MNRVVSAGEVGEWQSLAVEVHVLQHWEVKLEGESGNVKEKTKGVRTVRIIPLEAR